MIRVTLEGEHYVVALPKMTLVLTRDEFLTALSRGKWWKRRKVRADREAEMIARAAERRPPSPPVQRSAPDEGSKVRACANGEVVCAVFISGCAG
jgi:hypothetical protein